MKRKIREPIQVYLTDVEREELDRLAGELAISRSEALRRGIAALRDPARPFGPTARLAGEGILTPPLNEAAGPPPAGPPVAPLQELLAELRTDRDGR